MSKSASILALAPSHKTCAFSVLVLLGGILNGYAAPVLEWSLADGADATIPIGAVNLVIIAAALSQLQIWRVPMLGKPGVADAIASLAILAPSSALSWGTVIIFGAFCAWRTDKSTRPGYLLLSGLGAVNLWETVAIQWFASPFAEFDAILTGATLSMFEENVFRFNNIVGTDAHSIILQFGCTTVFSLPKLILLEIAALIQLRAVRLRTYFVCAILVAVLVTAANIIRLTLTASSAGAYKTLHGSTAFDLFDFLLVGIVGTIAFVAGKRQCGVV